MSAPERSKWSGSLVAQPSATLLVRQTPNGPVKPFAVGGEVLLGRLDECDLVLDGTEISRHHAKITSQDGSYYLEDLKSLNGTYVNQQRCRDRQQLFHGDVIQFASASGPLLTFEIHGPHAGDDQQHGHAPHRPAVQMHVPRPTAMISLAEMDADDEPDRDSVASGADAVAKLNAVLAVTAALGNSLDLTEVLENALAGLFQVFPQAQSGYVLLRDDPAGPLAVKAMRNRLCDSSTLAPLNQSLADQACRGRAAILSSEAGEDSTVPDDVVGDFRVRSYMCAPLVGSSDAPLGAIQIDTNIDASKSEAEFTHRDLDVLASLAAITGQAIENSQLHEARVELARRERELAVAREVQLQFLPSGAPIVPGYDFCEYYAAADEVAGDFFDYVPLSDGRLALVIGDVCGKGISAALLMAQLCATARWCLHSAAGSPAEGVRRLNDELMEHCRTDRFVSMLVCVLDPRRHQLTIVNAGHPTPLLWRADERKVVAVGADLAGVPLGIKRGQAYQQFQLPIRAGDSLVCYTDGVSEAMSPQGALFGVSSIADCLSRNPLPLDAMHGIIENVRGFSQNSRSDDICLLAFGRLAEARHSKRGQA